jgi:predicted dehydrogenase
MERTKTGVIGAGTVGKKHAKMYQELPDSVLLGIFDTNTGKAQDVAKEIGIIAIDNLDDMINEVDAVSIATPSASHYELAKKVIENGKHVLIEKPMSNTVEQARELIDLAEKNNCRIQVGCVERYNSAIKALEDIPIHPDYIEAQRLSPFNSEREKSDVIIDLMLDDIDLILFLVKSEAVNISSNSASVISSGIDIVNARIEFENGCVANLTASRIARKRVNKTRLYQKNQQITIDYVEGLSELFYVPEQDQGPFHDGTLSISLGKVRGKEIKYNRLQREQVNPLRAELRNFIVGIRNNLPMIPSAQEGLASLKIAEQIIKQINEQRQN